MHIEKKKKRLLRRKEKQCAQGKLDLKQSGGSCQGRELVQIVLAEEVRQRGGLSHKTASKEEVDAKRRLRTIEEETEPQIMQSMELEKV
jgi:hypothetical protein